MTLAISKADVLRLVEQAGKLDEFEQDWGRPLSQYLDEYDDDPDVRVAVLGDLGIPIPAAPSAVAPVSELERLDAIAREAWSGNYERAGALSTGERLYVALASGRMRELAPHDSIAYAVQRIGPEWMAHMIEVWRNSTQPKEAPGGGNGT